MDSQTPKTSYQIKPNPMLAALAAMAMAGTGPMATLSGGPNHAARRYSRGKAPDPKKPLVGFLYRHLHTGHVRCFYLKEKTDFPYLAVQVSERVEERNGFLIRSSSRFFVEGIASSPRPYKEKLFDRTARQVSDWLKNAVLCPDEWQ